MPANTPDEWRLSKLNHEIARLEAETSELEAERVAQTQAATRARGRRRYFGVLRRLRAPAAAFELWPVGVMIVGPLVAGGLLLVIVHALTASTATSLLAFLLGAGAGAAACASLLYRPADALLPAAVAEAESAERLADARLNAALERLTTVRREHAGLIEERRQLMASGQVQRAALLQREWKAMPAAEWEDFVVEVLRTLGASVERLPRTTEPDATLLADFGDRRAAILTRGEGHVVNSNAVNQALAGQKRHATERSAAVINRRFTGAAQDYAQRHGCTLIGVEEFPDFVMGKIDL